MRMLPTSLTWTCQVRSYVKQPHAIVLAHATAEHREGAGHGAPNSGRLIPPYCDQMWPRPNIMEQTRQAAYHETCSFWNAIGRLTANLVAEQAGATEHTECSQTRSRT